MDYEKKYNEALERARALWREAIEKEYPNDYLKDYETIFPELAESEDERIRKWLVGYFSSIKETVWIHRDITCGQILAYLEKQKEQNEDVPLQPIIYTEQGEVLAEQKPAWSEEDEKMRDRLITRLNWITYNTRTDGTSPNITFFDEIDWLKSLRPPFKPSEEQMEALQRAIDACESEWAYQDDELRSLLNDLKKL